MFDRDLQHVFSFVSRRATLPDFLRQRRKGEAVGDAHEALFWRSGGLRMVLAGGWKLQVDARRDKRWLFDLEADPTEQMDLAGRKPGKVRELQARLDAHDDEMGPRDFPVLVEVAIPIDRSIAAPHVPGEEFAYWPN